MICITAIVVAIELAIEVATVSSCIHYRRSSPRRSPLRSPRVNTLLLAAVTRRRWADVRRCSVCSHRSKYHVWPARYISGGHLIPLTPRFPRPWIFWVYSHRKSEISFCMEQLTTSSLFGTRRYFTLFVIRTCFGKSKWRKSLKRV